MKRFAWLAVLAVLLLGGALAVGAKGKGPAPEHGRGAIVAEVLGMDPEAFRQAVREKGLRALLEEKGMDLKTFRSALIDAREKRLEEAYAAGKIPEARYALLKKRLAAERALLARPSWEELVAKAGGDLKALKAELKAERKAEIEKLYALGLISPVQKGKMLANLDRWVEGVLRRPAGAFPGRGGLGRPRGRHARPGFGPRPGFKGPMGPRPAKRGPRR